VIEVGVDVPNANLMIIENSERLGLSQLHQLRGRIGRGDKKSSCVLLYGKKLSDLAKQRLKIIYETDDGFEIAEQDLKLRGPGEFIGLRQSGLPSLKISDLSRDMLVLEEVKKEADQLLLSNDPLIEKYLDRWLPNHQSIVKA
jgi:ATP-dependent DNA helicase RecG